MKSDASVFRSPVASMRSGKVKPIPISGVLTKSGVDYSSPRELHLSNRKEYTSGGIKSTCKTNREDHSSERQCNSAKTYKHKSNNHH